MGFIAAIIIGAFVGWIASMIMKTNEQQGCIANIAVGVVGALLSQFIFGSVLKIGGAEAAGTFSLMGVLWATIGAAILIAILRAIGVFK